MPSPRSLSALIVVLAAGICAGGARADDVIYTWTDAEGTVHITDEEPPSSEPAQDLRRRVMPEPPPVQERSTFTSPKAPLVQALPPSIAEPPQPAPTPAQRAQLRDVALATQGYSPLGCGAALLSQAQRSAINPGAQERQLLAACPTHAQNPALLLSAEVRKRLEQNRAKAARSTGTRLGAQARTGVDLMRPLPARTLGR